MKNSILVIWSDGSFDYSGPDIGQLKNYVINRCLSEFILPPDIQRVTLIENGEIKEISLTTRSMLRMAYRSNQRVG